MILRGGLGRLQHRWAGRPLRRLPCRRLCRLRSLLLGLAHPLLCCLAHSVHRTAHGCCPGTVALLHCMPALYPCPLHLCTHSHALLLHLLPLLFLLECLHNSPCYEEQGTQKKNAESVIVAFILGAPATPRVFTIPPTDCRTWPPAAAAISAAEVACQ